MAATTKIRAPMFWDWVWSPAKACSMWSSRWTTYRTALGRYRIASASRAAGCSGVVEFAGAYGVGAGVGDGAPREPAHADVSTTASNAPRRSGIMRLALGLGAPENGHHVGTFAGHAQQLPASLPHVGPPGDEFLPLLGCRAEHPQVGHLLPMRGIRLRRWGH